MLTLEPWLKNPNAIDRWKLSPFIFWNGTMIYTKNVRIFGLSVYELLHPLNEFNKILRNTNIGNPPRRIVCLILGLQCHQGPTTSNIRSHKKIRKSHNINSISESRPQYRASSSSCIVSFGDISWTIWIFQENACATLQIQMCSHWKQMVSFNTAYFYDFFARERCSNIYIVASDKMKMPSEQKIWQNEKSENIGHLWQ